MRQRVDDENCLVRSRSPKPTDQIWDQRCLLGRGDDGLRDGHVAYHYSVVDKYPNNLSRVVRDTGPFGGRYEKGERDGVRGYLVKRKEKFCLC